MINKIYYLEAPSQNPVGCQSSQRRCVVYLYGSTARGETHASSDLDIAVLYVEEPPPTLDGLGLELASALERYMGQPVGVLSSIGRRLI